LRPVSNGETYLDINPSSTDYGYFQMLRKDWSDFWCTDWEVVVLIKIDRCIEVYTDWYNNAKRISTTKCYPEERCPGHRDDSWYLRFVKALKLEHVLPVPIAVRGWHMSLGSTDYKVYKDNHPYIPKDIEDVWPWITGSRKRLSATRSLLPLKKEKDCELTVQQKEHNKNHSQKRIVIEHAICRIKKYRIMNDVFRNRLRKYDRISDIVSGLINYRIMNPV
jgi:hypothetical protein